MGWEGFWTEREVQLVGNDWEYMIEENVEWKEKMAMGDENQKYKNWGLIVSNMSGFFEDESVSKTQKIESEFSKGKPSNRDENSIFLFYTVIPLSTYKIQYCIFKQYLCCFRKVTS